MNDTSSAPAEHDRQHYRMHVFCCVNERPADHPRSCCKARGSQQLHAYMKQRTKQLGIPEIRINQAGCLERCELGPVMVIYPEGVWYTFENQDDIDEIVERHMVGGERVERLLLPPGQKFPEPRAPQRLTLRVAAITELTSSIRGIELVDPDARDLPAFTAGAHIDIFTATGQRRSYSLANDPADRRRYMLGVLREAGGQGSCWVCDGLGVGDSVTVAPPRNNFQLVETARRHTLIAGGIGITPLLAMGHRLAAMDADFRLHYCTKSVAHTAFLDDVQAVFGDRVHMHHDGGDPARGIDLAAVLAKPADGEHLYVCGPEGLMQAVCRHAGHWPDDTLHFERFSADPVAAPGGNEAFDIVLSKRKMPLHVPAGKSILEVVQGAGMPAESSCENGICGACETRLLGGQAEHRDQVLSNAEKSANSRIMICVSRARGGETLILDI